MLWPAESIYEGTWGSGPIPVEVQWIELMREYRWSWQEFEQTPTYVRRVSWDLMVARRQAQRAADEARERKRGG